MRLLRAKALAMTKTNNGDLQDLTPQQEHHKKMTKLIYYTNASQDNPFDKFLDSLTEVQQRKILRILANIQNYGLTNAIPHIKKLTNTPLWEIRILGQDNIRVFYATLLENSILILHGFSKKTQKTPPREIETALNRLKDWLDS